MQSSLFTTKRSSAIMPSSSRPRERIVSTCFASVDQGRQAQVRQRAPDVPAEGSCADDCDPLAHLTV
jgi:hypothetical protein